MYFAVCDAAPPILLPGAVNAGSNTCNAASRSPADPATAAGHELRGGRPPARRTPEEPTGPDDPACPDPVGGGHTPAGSDGTGPPAPCRPPAPCCRPPAP